MFVAQNFYTAQRETGRMNGGVGALLVPQATSDKTADLGAVWPDVSGILVPEDAKSVAAVDINGDGWQDLVVAVNDGSPRCFLQRPPESPAPLRVNLQGLPGNASAVGAQILAVEHDGQQSLHVLMAGEGYLTQRPPYVYLPEIPERLIVQWPDGQRSEHEVNSNVTGSMSLKHPALP